MINADFSAARWTKSSYSGNSGNCVEVATAHRAVGVRDSKRPGTGHLVFHNAAWATFLSTTFSAENAG